MIRFKEWLKSFHLRYFSHPKHERGLYRHVHKTCPSKIVEIGMGDGARAERLIRYACERSDGDEIRYTGIDWFEAKEVSTGWSLKSAHQQLKAAGGKVRLFPGDPFSVLSKQANGLAKTDLIIIDAEVDDDTMNRAWFYLPRMLHDETAVFVVEQEHQEEDDDDIVMTMRQIPAHELRIRAGSNANHIAKAA